MELSTKIGTTRLTMTFEAHTLEEYQKLSDFFHSCALHEQAMIEDEEEPKPINRMQRL